MLTEQELRVLVDDPRERRTVSAQHLTEALLARIAGYGAQFNAFVTTTSDIALAAARRVDDARASGTPLPLDGMPIALKDNIDLAGVRCTIRVAALFTSHRSTRCIRRRAPARGRGDRSG